MYKSNKIVIVGGGSAGWMSASTLIKFFPNKNITVVESPNIPTIGVGESTLGYIKFWVDCLGIDEKDFFKYTNASLKLSIKFTDFYKKNSGSFHYPFGNPFMGPCFMLGSKSWLYKKIFKPETPASDYALCHYPIVSLIEKNKINENDNGELENFCLRTDSAYHFDATLFAEWLANNYCQPKGVKRIRSEIKKVCVNDDGVEKVILDDGTELFADLFIDCTGWKSLLIGSSLKEPFISYNDIIPNDRAWATQIPYIDKKVELEPYTNCTAISNGWVWNIPLWSRIGTGYVYSDKFISKEDALEEFKQFLKTKTTIPCEERITEDLSFKDIEMRIGIHERTWVKNVVAIGLSAGFIEPLESNGLFTVHEFLMQLVNIIERENINQWDVDGYNLVCKKKYDGFCKFVSLHYLLSQRDDSEYWKYVSKISTSNRIVDGDMYDTFYSAVVRKNLIHQHDNFNGVACIANGLNYNFLSKEHILNQNFYNKTFNSVELVNQIDNSWDQLKVKWNQVADKSPTLFEYLQKKFYT